MSVHIGSQIRSAAPFGAALARVRALVGELAEDGIRIRYVDAGGGLGIDYAARWAPRQFDAASEVAAYAAALTEGLRGLKVRLLLEPGRFLVAQAGALVARVLYRKRNGAKEFLITDAGDERPDPARRCTGRTTRLSRSTRPAERCAGATMDVVGPVCETGDFFARDRVMLRCAAGRRWLRCWMPALMGCRWRRTTTRAGAPAEVLVEGRQGEAGAPARDDRGPVAPGS